MAIGDIYDMLTSVRNKTQCVRPEQAIDIIVKNSGIFFDPNIVAVSQSIQEKFI